MLSWEIRAIRLGVLLTCRQEREREREWAARSHTHLLFLSFMSSTTSALSLDVLRLFCPPLTGKVANLKAFSTKCVRSARCVAVDSRV